MNEINTTDTSRNDRKDLVDLAKFKLDIIKSKMEWISDSEIARIYNTSESYIRKVRSQSAKEIYQVYFKERDDIILAQITKINDWAENLLKIYEDSKTKPWIKVAIFDRLLEAEKYIWKLVWVNMDRVESKHIHIDASKKFMEAFQIPKKLPTNIEMFVQEDESKIIKTINNKSSLSININNQINNDE